MSVNGNVAVQRSVLPDGIAGVDTTVRKMVTLAHSQWGSKSARVRAKAIDILRQAGVAQKDYYGELVAIHNWVRDNVRYVHDPVGQETLSTPEETLFNSLAGDCLDDKTRLLTPTGYIAIRDAKPGMIIQGKAGWTKVLKVWNKGFLPAKCYDLANGGSFVATDDHRCFLLNGTEKKASELKPGDALLGPAPIDLPKTRGKLTADDCYFVGIYLADGWADGNRVCIAGKDGFAKEAQKKWVETYAKGQGWETSWHPRYIRVYLPKTHYLASFFFSGALAPEKAIPDAVLAELTPEKTKRLLAGIMSDSHDPLTSRRTIGAEQTRKPRGGRGGVCFSTTSDALALQVRLLFRLTGVDISDSKIVDHGGLGTHPVHRIYPRYFRSKPARVEEITEVGVRPVWDIETEDHGIYLPDADVVVHNCDDMVITEISLLGSVGIESYPVVVGTAPGSFSHVYLYGIVPQSNAGRYSGATIPLDPIMKNWPAGKEAGADMGIESKKTYPELSNPLTNGLPMSGLGKTPRRRIRNRGISDLGQLGAYAVAPAYVDEQEEAQANRICIPNNMASYTHKDKTVANGTRATIKPEGLDAMFSGLGAATADEIASHSSTQAGGYLSSTSAGDGGSVIKSGGQLVPTGYIRDEPDLQQSMAMQPTTAARLGPAGPIFAQRAAQNRSGLDPRTNPNVQHVKGGAITWGATVKRNVGGKRYDLPGVQQALRAAGGLSPNPVALNRSTPVVSVSSSMPMDRIGARAMPAQSLSGALADAEAELASTLPAARAAMQQAARPQALHYAEALAGKVRQLTSRAKTLEGNILQMRQKMRDQALAGTSRSRVRAAAVLAGQQSILRKDQMTYAATPPPGMVNGLGAWVKPLRTMGTSRVPYVTGTALAVGPHYATSGRIGARRAQGLTEMRSTQPVTVAGFGDISLSSPLVWGPALAFIGVFAFMKLRKPRATA